MTSAAAGYRGEIDGLRAIAITSVVAYHIGTPGIPGGFAGVDVFFVISGYLITSLLLKEQLERGSIDLAGFYARRARRLLPAFFVVLFASTVAAALLLLPLQEEMGSYTRSVRHAAIYLSNLHFAQTSGGYFDAPTELMPLLHTWSLAVEEQFYIGWPLLLILAFFLARRRYANRTALIVGLLVVIGVASFAFNVHGAGREGRVGQSAFYMLHSRAWELGIGAALAVALPSPLRPRPYWLGDLLCAGGLLGIGAAFLTLDGSLAYPGTAALLPVVSTAAVIGGASLAPGGFLVRVLGARPIAAIGLLSYGWYLWHWPLLAFARIAWLGERDLARDAFLAALALGLAWLTYVIIESPIRQRRIWATWSSRGTLGVSAALTGLLFAASLGLDYRASLILGDPTHPLANVFAATVDGNPTAKLCNNGGRFKELGPFEDCSTPTLSGKRILLWGDSHAGHVARMAEASASAQRIGVTQRSRGGCAPVLGTVPAGGASKQAICKAFNELVLREIQQLRDQGLVGVIIAARWTSVQNKPFISTLHREGFGLVPIDAPPAPALDVLEAGVRRTVDLLTGLGLKVLVLGPVPEQRYRAPWCVARRSAQTCSVSREEQLAYRADVMKALATAIDGNSLARIADPFEQLCDSEVCPAQINGIVLYRDDDHLSAAGAMRLTPWFSPFVGWLAQADAIPPETGSTQGISSATSR